MCVVLQPTGKESRTTTVEFACIVRGLWRGCAGKISSVRGKEPDTRTRDDEMSRATATHWFQRKQRSDNDSIQRGFGVTFGCVCDFLWIVHTCSWPGSVVFTRSVNYLRVLEWVERNLDLLFVRNLRCLCRLSHGKLHAKL